MTDTKPCDCKLIELERHHSDRKGTISVVTGRGNVDFDLRRVYYIYDLPVGAARGAHAHRSLHQLIVAVSGSFSVTVTDGREQRTFRLDRPYVGLHLVPGLWRTLDDFTSGAVCLVVASESYDESDYIRDYDEFLKYKGITDDDTIS